MHPTPPVVIHSLGVSHTNRGVLQALASNSQTWDATGLADALFLLPSSTYVGKRLFHIQSHGRDTPVVRLTFSSNVNCLTTSMAFLYASAQSPAPLPQGLGYLGGDVWSDCAPAAAFGLGEMASE